MQKRTYRKPAAPRRPRSEAAKEEHRRKVEESGGWYLFLRHERERREITERMSQADQIKTLPQRQVITKE